MMTEGINLSALLWMHICQIAVLGLIVGGINLAISRRWPHLAYALWLVVLAKCFVPPIGIGPVDLWGSWPPTLGEVTDGVASNGSELPGEFTSRSQAFAAGVPQDAHARLGTTTPSATTSTVFRIAAGTTRQLVERTALVVWLAGSVFLLGIAIGRGSEAGRRLRRTSTPVAEQVQAIVQRTSQRIGLRRPARVLQTSSDTGPLVAGTWRPTIYLPEVLLDRTPPAQLEAMLMHELAHVRRRDTWVAALQFAAQIVWWFHPAVWWMNRQLTRERERCCDEEVVANLAGRRSDYARLLISVLESKHRLEPLWGYPAVRPVELTRRRLEEIMKRKNMVHARAPWWCWTIAAAGAVLVLPGAGTSAATDERRQPAAPRVAQDAPRSSELGSTRERPPALLSYGDGKADGKKSYGGNGHMIRFELPEGVTHVRGLRIHGSRYGLPQAPDEDFEITFLSDDREETLDSKSAPYRLFKRGKETWVRVLFDEEIELPQTFWVALNFHAHQTKGVYVSYDTSTKGEHSRVGLPGDEEEPKETDFGGDWMVQVMLPRSAAATQR
jgi:beta-lactamase regulating signal transducer with metallopeptidase domain